jgi:hypothetical protein
MSGMSEVKRSDEKEEKYKREKRKGNDYQLGLSDHIFTQPSLHHIMFNHHIIVCRPSWYIYSNAVIVDRRSSIVNRKSYRFVKFVISQ